MFPVIEEAPVRRQPHARCIPSLLGALRKCLRDNGYACDVIAVFGAALVLYSTFISCSFNEGDSFNFAKALVKVDLVMESPHPPGYPIYVFLGRVLFSLIGDQLAGLAWISVISGALTLVPLYFLARAMYNRMIAILTCVVLMVVPGFWLASEKATTDILSTFLVTLGVTMLYFGMKGNNAATLLSWMIYAISVGVRPTHIAFIPLWLYGTLRRKSLGAFFSSIVVFVTMVLAWLAPVIWVTGWDRFLAATRDVYIGTANTDFVFARPLGLSSFERLVFSAAAVFTFALGGMLPEMSGLKFPFASNNVPAFYIFHDMLLTVALLCLILNFRRSIEKIFALLWIIPHFAFVYLLGSPIHHRYYLPIYPALTLLAISSIANLAVHRRWPRFTVRCSQIARLAVVLLIIGTLVAHSMPLAAKLHTEPSPITQLVKYVKENYDSKKTTVLVFHECSAFDIYAPGFRHYHCRKQATETLLELKLARDTDRITLVTSTAYEYLISHHLVMQLEARKIAEFYLDPRGEIEDHRVSLFVVQTARLS